MTISIMVAEQERMTRECLVRLLEAESDFSVVGQVADGRSAVVMACQLRPAVAVVDFNLPVLNGIETVRHMHAEEVKAVRVSTGSDDAGESEELALQAGAAVCLGQGCNRADFLAAIRQSVVELPARERGGRGAGGWRARRATKRERGTLTPREREVLQLLAEGYVTKEISDLLTMSSKTVSTHRVHIKEKLGTRSIALLTKFALRTGLTHL
jgi:DNA-binding NarL/FixJ family response regulator